MARPGFVVHLSRQLAGLHAHTYRTERRASVAIILRISDMPQYFPRLMGKDMQSRDVFLSCEAAVRSTVHNSEILYIKRSSHPSDPWSGNVAFPGGKREEFEQDYQAAVREVREEINLDLEAGPFAYLGRLDDRPVYARGAKAGGFALCPFVFVQTSAETPPMTLSKDEVAAVRWVPVAELVEDNVNPMGISMPFRFIPGVEKLPSMIRSFIGIDLAHYPSINLPYPAADVSMTTQVQPSVSSRFGAASSSLAGRALAELSTLPASDNQEPNLDNPSASFQLWGLTLQATSDLLALAGLRRLNWPPLRLNSAFTNMLVYTLCGAVEIREVLAATRRLDEVSLKHVSCAVVGIAGPLLIATCAIMRLLGKL
jgi:8-oxo-dGTP pyrophosphatase MutT (NUDIX family)